MAAANVVLDANQRPGASVAMSRSPGGGHRRGRLSAGMAGPACVVETKTVSGRTLQEHPSAQREKAEHADARADRDHQECLRDAAR
ncbi:hypothetical protein L1080_024795 [Rhodococcus sp. MSC1_016]|uniref:hypothetical protein n=1 Tax=Rhodococcus sp. MSC1_016 TaxID=2909266 RepID=UPI00202E5953|nr:hypothetical protein [Rhodococcus sp. MSC1_016]